jgi:homoserine O-acetyltransferase
MMTLALVRRAALGLLAWCLAGAAAAADYPAPRQASWTARDFRFHTGEMLPEVKLAYTTLGNPAGEPVLVLHGTAGSAATMLNPGFAGELFGAGQPLDASRYFIILPDALGAGQSSKPSDGLRAKFPRYNYDDMVLAQYRLVSEGLGIKHLRLVIGNSMGGMHTWLWGVKYPGFMDALVPMAAQAGEMSARNWVLRRMLVESVRQDPDYQGGNYTAMPRSLKLAAQMSNFATNGGTQAYYHAAPTRAAADKLVDERLAAPFNVDANDFVYQWDASHDYNAAPGLDRIRAALLAINSADDERNPPELGTMERDLARVKGGALFLIPASSDTRGHGTTGAARLWKDRLAQFLQGVTRGTP